DATEILTVDILDPSDPSCGGGGTGECATVAISFPDGNITPATCTNSDGEVIFRINPFIPSVNNTGVIIDIDGPVSRTNVNDSVFSNLPIGVYNFTVQYGDPSCIKTGTVTVDQSGTVGTPIASNVVEPECFGNASGAVTIDVDGETGNTLEWSLDGTIWNTFIAGTQITGIPAGPAPSFEQVISVRRNSSDPCNAAVTVVINNGNDELDIDTSTTEASCDNNDGSIIVDAVTGGSGTYSYRLDGAFFDDLPTDNTFGTLAGGDHILTVIDDGVGGCERDFTIIVPFPGLVDFDTNVKDPDCDNGTASNGRISVIINSVGSFQVGISTSAVDDPSEFFNITSDGNDSIPFNDLTKGTYYVTVVSTGATCPNRREVTIADGPSAVSFDYEFGCISEIDNKELLLTNITGDNNVEYVLRVREKFGDVVDSISFNLSANGSERLIKNRAFLNLIAEYELELVQDDQPACLGTELAYQHPESLVIPGDLTAVIAESTESLPDRPTGSFKVINFSGGLAPYQTRVELDSASIQGQSFMTEYEPVTQNNEFELEAFYQNVPAGRYLVEVIDTLGCVVPLVARVDLNTEIRVPNIFTPNGDGANDLFVVRNLPSEGAVLVINNRWGNEIFSSDNYQNAWDGGD
ncbi:hypothetical protein E1176_01835, partial [Fulvivirga sp. RKSG066]|uniref:T9SS type B sorting domain-containing protein n=1 Tax=Fulvivirga aurantia TaxID=2529383 RepID=UPI0012BB7B96